MIRNALQRPKNEPIVFSSDDSMNTDNSFNSSIDGENNDDYKNSFWHLKEQMQQFFVQNPSLQDSIKFAPMKFDEDSEDEKKHKPIVQSANNPNTQSQPQISKKQKKENREKSKLWSMITKDIIKNGQFASQVPSLETVNHRLNIFKKKIEKVDYIEILSKETAKQKKPVEKKKEEKKVEEKKKEGEEDEQQDQTKMNEGETQFYSFKKKMQSHFHQKMEKKVELENEVKQQHKEQNNEVKSRTNLNVGASIKPNQSKKNKKDGENNEDKAKDDNKQSIILDKDIEFQSKFGQVLYQTLKQYQNDVESFKKTAIFLLKDYNNNKAKLYKQKIFPPQITKFTSDETKSLNILLPDFSNPLFQANKQNLFQGIENYQLPEGTAESQFIQNIDKILNGKVLALWKEAQNNN